MKKNTTSRTTTAKTKGVLMIGVGHPNYGSMCLNLAMSIKYSSPNTKIAVVHSENSLNYIRPENRSFFDHLIECPKEYYTRGGNTEWIKTKVHMYDLSPFDETIFIDADNLMLPQCSIDKVFKEMTGKSFMWSNRGSLLISKAPDDFSVWANMRHIEKEYPAKGSRWYQLHSEFIYFKKSKKNEKFFQKSIDVYENLKVPHRSFGGGIPDELPFGIACILTNQYPEKEPWTPVYWEVAEKKGYIGKDMMQQGFIAYSTGGSHHDNRMKNFYNNLVRFYANNFGVQHPYKLRDKRTWAQERSNF